MNVVIRTDASTEIGTGHVMRCLTLADMLVTRGANVRFICRAFKGNMAALIQQRGYHVQLLPMVNECYKPDVADTEYSHWLGVSQDEDSRQTFKALALLDSTDWMVIDHYAIDERWEKAIRLSVGNIMVIDCLANRFHDCDLLLDQNLYTSTEDRYSKLVPKTCRVLVGPQFALLRSEFIQAWASLRKRDGQIRRILIQFGGVDVSNETSKALDAVIAMNLPDISIDVVVGSNNTYCDQIKKRCKGLTKVTLHCQTKQVARLMAAADLAIGAGGTTNWERCYLGLPSMIVMVAENQRPATEALDAQGAAWNLGWYEDVDVDMIRQAVERAMNEPQQLISMGKECLRIMRGDDSEAVPPNLVEIMIEGVRSRAEII